MHTGPKIQGDGWSRGGWMDGVPEVKRAREMERKSLVESDR